VEVLRIHCRWRCGCLLPSPACRAAAAAPSADVAAQCAAGLALS
jgi:hypothetical protein